MTKTKQTISKNTEYIILEIKPFKDNEMGISHRDTVMKNISVLKKKKISFIISGNQFKINMYVKLPKIFESFFKNTFFANYESSDLEEPGADELIKINNSLKNRNYVHYKRKYDIHDKKFFQKEGIYMDPMKDIFALFSNINKSDLLTFVFTYTFKQEFAFVRFMQKVMKIAWGSNIKKKEISDGINQENTGTGVDEKAVFTNISYNLQTQDSYHQSGIKTNIKSVLSIFGGKFKLRNHEQYFPMSYSQVINFFHIPTQDVFVKGLEYCVYKKLPFPSTIPTSENTNKDDLTILGNTHYRGEAIEFGIKKDDKFRHMYIVGKTGTGKSTFMSNMIKSDMENGNGLCLIDPHGDLVDTVLEHIPPNRINDVILFDVADTDYPIGFNLLQAENEDEKNRIVSGVVSTFYKLFEHSRGPRLEYILRNVVLTVIDYPNATLMHILRVLVDKEFREEVVSHVQDSVVKKFWESEFNKWNDRQREEAIGPITNKIGQFLSSRIVRNIFGQPQTKLNIRKAMDEGKILLVNLSKGKIGEDNATMIGSLLVTKIQIDVMSRADVSWDNRKDFYLYIDEFQNFATKSFATILSEARKYRLSLIIANQFTAQLNEDVRDAIFGNVGSVMAFTLGKDDAEIISSQYKDIASTNDLISLPMFTAYINMMVDGVNPDPFSMKTMPLPRPEGSLELIDKVRTQSRQRYAMEKNRLEKLMDAWSKKSFTIHDKVAEKARLQGLGISNVEIANMQDFFVQNNISVFSQKMLGGEEADAIIFDTVNKKHKIVWYQKPTDIDNSYKKIMSTGQEMKIKENGNFKVYIDVYHSHRDDLLQIWVGDKKNVLQQLKEVYHSKENIKFVPNIEKLEMKSEKNVISVKKEIYKKSNTQNIDSTSIIRRNNNNLQKLQNFSLEEQTSPTNANKFSIKDIKTGEWYKGLVKLKYNYGMFVTVKGVEGLLHKKQIVPPEGVEWKKFYNIGDDIEVKAMEFKDINGEKKVVWSQKK